MWKKRRFLPSLCLIVVWTAAGAEDNLFANPGFETWSDNLNRPDDSAWRWLLPEGGEKAFERFGRSDREKYSGNWSLHLKDNDTGRINQNFGFQIPPNQISGLRGKQLTFSVQVKQVAASSPKTVGISISVRRGGSWRHTGSRIDSTGPTGWRQLTCRTQITEDTELVFLYFNCTNGWGNTGEAYFDDVSVTAGEPVVLDEAVTMPAVPPPPTVSRRKVAAGEPFLKLYHPLPPAWQLKSWGGVSTESGAGPELRLIVSETMKPFAGIAIESPMLNRSYDLTKVPPGKLKVSFRTSRNIPVHIRLNSGEVKLNSGVAEKDGRFLYEAQLDSFRCSFSEFGLFRLQFPQKLESGVITFRDFAIVSAIAADEPEFARSKEAETLLQELNTPFVLENDGNTRPEIRNGTWYWQGKPHFFVGPWIYNRKTTDWGPDRNSLGIDHIAYQEGPSKKVFDAVGFDSAQISAALSLPGQILYGLGIPKDARQKLADSTGFFREFEGQPLVVDFAFGFHNALKTEQPEKHRELNQRHSDWHEFLPLCPEHPEGDRYYRDYIRGGLVNALKNGANPMVYEIFNESSYDCQCRFNAASFARRMQKKYAGIQAANARWQTAFASFSEVAQITDFRSYPRLWPEWCDFISDRYVEILNDYAGYIRSIDRRGRVYITEQLIIASVFTGRFAGIDYRKVAGAMDVLATEGGWKFGRSEEQQARSGAEEVVVGSGVSHWYVNAFYQALAKGKKPVINNEHYCTRIEHGIRVPSRKTDMITALWSEVVHGLSANYTYCWDKRSFDWKTFEQAKANVITPSYKSSSLLNPYNWPVSELDAFKEFNTELEPLAELLLPFPRAKPGGVALFHSYPTMRMLYRLRSDFKTQTLNWFGALQENQYPVRIIFEEELLQLDPEVKVIVFPCSDYVKPEILPALKQFIRRGGLVVADRNALRFDEIGDPLTGVPQEIYRFDAAKTGSATALLELLREKQIPRHGTVTPADGGELLREVDLQIIDRGDFKFIYLVNMYDIGSRLIHVKLFLEDEGEFHLADLVNQVRITGPRSTIWTKENLAAGFELLLPPQERVLLTLEREAKPGFTECPPVMMKERFATAQKAESAYLADFNARGETLRQKEQAARLWPGVKPTKCRPVDLRGVVNMAFADETAGDGKGGWFDQGDNDFGNMPLGSVTAAGVPFEIIDPAENGGRSALILFGRNRDNFPKTVENIPVEGKAARLYFLHTMGWYDAPGTRMLTYRLHYRDGGTTDIPVRAAREIGGWWGTPVLPDAKIAIESTNLQSRKINLQCFRWINPAPDREITALDIISGMASGVPAVVAITLEHP